MSVKLELFPVLTSVSRGVLAFFVIAVSGCQLSDQPAKTVATDTTVVPSPPVARRPWVVLYSYSPIGAGLRPMVQISYDTVWAGREITRAEWTEPVILANSGIGLANAAATTQRLIDRYNPLGIIFCGIAAPLNPAHLIGDIMIPESFISFDYGYWGDKGFSTDSMSVGRLDSAGFERLLAIPVDDKLYAKMGIAADNAAYRFRKVSRRLPEIHRGGIGISANAFLDNKPRREQLFKQLKAQITDTESAAVVQTCYAAGVPVVVVRACAAPVGESAKPEAQKMLKDFFEVAAHNVALVIQQFFETPEP